MSEQTSPRVFNMIVGIWLFVSAFLWPHTSAQFTNSLVVGATCTVAAAIGFRAASWRYVNLILAIWLFFSTWLLAAESPGTLWNNVIASILMFIIALVPNHTPAIARR